MNYVLCIINVYAYYISLKILPYVLLNNVKITLKMTELLVYRPRKYRVQLMVYYEKVILNAIGKLPT